VWLPALVKPGVYISFEQAKDTWALPDGLVIRTTGDPAALAPPVRRWGSKLAKSHGAPAFRSNGQ